MDIVVFILSSMRSAGFWKAVAATGLLVVACRVLLGSGRLGANVGGISTRTAGFLRHLARRIAGKAHSATEVDGPVSDAFTAEDAAATGGVADPGAGAACSEQPSIAQAPSTEVLSAGPPDCAGESDPAGGTSREPGSEQVYDRPPCAFSTGHGGDLLSARLDDFTSGLELSHRQGRELIWLGEEEEADTAKAVPVDDRPTEYLTAGNPHSADCRHEVTVKGESDTCDDELLTPQQALGAANVPGSSIPSGVARRQADFEDMASLHSLQGKEQEALQEVFLSLFAGPTAAGLASDRTPIPPLPPSKPVWPTSLLIDICRQDGTVAVFALEALHQRLLSGKYLPAPEQLNEWPWFFLGLATRSGDVVIKAVAGACCALSLVRVRQQSDPGPGSRSNPPGFDELKGLLACEGDPAARLAFSMAVLDPAKAFDLLARRWSAGDRSGEVWRVLRLALDTSMPLPEELPSILTLLSCQLVRHGGEMAILCRFTGRFGVPSSVPPLARALLNLLLDGKDSKEEDSLVDRAIGELHRFTGTSTLAGRLLERPVDRNGLTEMLRICRSFYTDTRAPASSFLASALLKCIESGRMKRLFRMLCEETTGNLLQDTSLTENAPGGPAGLVPASGLAALGLLKGLARYWPVRLDTDTSLDRRLLVLALCCYARASFGGEFERRLSTLTRIGSACDTAPSVRPSPASSRKELIDLLLDDRDDIDAGLFRTALPEKDLLIDLLTSHGVAAGPEARGRLYVLLCDHPSPSVVFRALEELARGRRTNDVADGAAAAREKALHLLRLNGSRLARLLPAVVSRGDPSLVAVMLEALVQYEEENLVTILENHLDRLFLLCPDALGKVLVATMPLALHEKVSFLRSCSNQAAHPVPEGRLEAIDLYLAKSRELTAALQGLRPR